MFVMVVEVVESKGKALNIEIKGFVKKQRLIIEQFLTSLWRNVEK